MASSDHVGQRFPCPQNGELLTIHEEVSIVGDGPVCLGTGLGDRRHRVWAVLLSLQKLCGLLVDPSLLVRNNLRYLSRFYLLLSAFFVSFTSRQVHFALIGHALESL